MEFSVEGFIDDINLIYLKCQSPLVKITLRNVNYRGEFFTFVTPYKRFKSMIEMTYENYGYVLGSLVRVQLEYIPNREFNVVDVNFIVSSDYCS